MSPKGIRKRRRRIYTMLCRTSTHPGDKGTVFLVPEGKSITIGISKQERAAKPTSELRLSVNDADAMIAVLCSFVLGMETEQIYNLHDKVVNEVRKMASTEASKINEQIKKPELN